MSDMQKAVSSPASAASTDRRPFLVKVAAFITGGLATLFPFAVGWGVVIDPWRRSRAGAKNEGADAGPFVPVCTLDTLPADGIPRQFPVISDMTDAWTHAAGQRIGSVFLTRSEKEPNHVVAFTAACPHLGCAVDFDTVNNRFECPCHKSGFAKDGAKLFGPSRRGLDPLPVRIEDKAGVKEVCIHFERFEAGIAERKQIE